MSNLKAVPTLRRQFYQGIRTTLACLCCVVGNAHADVTGMPVLVASPAEYTPQALTTTMLGVARAGKRIVAVGDHGAIILSDDEGAHFRQARTVPIGSMLTSVSFANDRTGWAVGQWGAIVKTDDGGETWTLQRADLANDRPLFSVYFKNEKEGWAVGLWSLMLHSTNGGATWDTVTVPAPPGSDKADANLNGIFADAQGDLFIAAERGFILRSADAGATWTYAATGYEGSFWSGVALSDGTLLVAGLRGSIYRSEDRGATWQKASSPFHSSLDYFVSRNDGAVMAVGLDGVVLLSKDDGRTFSGSQRVDRAALTAAIETKDRGVLLFSNTGPMKQ